MCAARKARPTIHVGDKVYTWETAPAWLEEALPALGTYDENGDLHVDPDSLREAEENAMRNRWGNEFVGLMIWVTIGLFVGTFVAWLISLG